MQAGSLGEMPCGMSGCPKAASDKCYYCCLPLCEEHANKVTDQGEEWYCRECFLYLSVSGRIERPLARKIVPKVLVVDPEKCTGCRSCQLVCSFRFQGAYSNSDGAIRIRKFEPECLNVPVVCEHCDQPECVKVCPTQALSKDPETGLVLLDAEECTGCLECVAACPFDAIFPRPGSDVVVNCDLCKGDPRCVQVCETKALDWVNKYEVGERRNATLVRSRLSEPGKRGGNYG